MSELVVTWALPRLNGHVDRHYLFWRLIVMETRPKSRCAIKLETKVILKVQEVDLNVWL